MITIDWSDWKDRESCVVNENKYSVFVYHLQYDKFRDELFEVLTPDNIQYGKHDLPGEQLTVSLPQEVNNGRYDNYATFFKDANMQK